MILEQKNPRREFLGKVATGAALSIPAFLTSIDVNANTDSAGIADSEVWFNNAPE